METQNPVPKPVKFMAMYEAEVSRRVAAEEKLARIENQTKALDAAELRTRVYAEVMASVCHQLAVATGQKPDIVIRKAQSDVTSRLREYDSGWMAA